MTIVRGIPAHEVHAVRERIAPLVELGLRRQKSFTPAAVMASLEDGRRQLFVTCPAMDCALVTEILALPAETVLHIFLVAGRLPEDWAATLANLERWAADQGCAAVELRGRRGWMRRLKGYAAPRIIMRKELCHA